MAKGSSSCEGSSLTNSLVSGQMTGPAGKCAGSCMVGSSGQGDGVRVMKKGEGPSALPLTPRRPSPRSDR